MTRLTISLAALLLGAGTTVHAQPVQKAQTPAGPTFQVLSTQATTQESPLVQGIIARVRARFTTDAAFSKRVNDAIVRRDFAGARSLVAAVAQLPDTQVVIGVPTRSGTRRERRGLVRFASYDRAAASTFNPFYILITTENHAICFGLKATCADAIRKAGYEPNV
jgi:hypothetical protein